MNYRICLIEGVRSKFIFLCLFFGLFFLSPNICAARLEVSGLDNGQRLLRSLESLKDLDNQTWQVVTYPSIGGKALTLRLVGYPGKLRFDHPTSLKIHSGIRDWYLVDITLLNKRLSSDQRQAVAEFDLTPLTLELTNNRPLRLSLQGVISDLPIPPYLVDEWRFLAKSKED